MKRRRSAGITLHIGELVLHGFDARQRHAIGDAVQAELARLIEAHGVGEVEDVVQLDGGTFTLTTTARSTGEEIARALFRALRP